MESTRPTSGSHAFVRSNESSTECTNESNDFRFFVVLAIVQLLVYAWLVFLSRSFGYDAPTLGRPIPLVVGLFGFNFGLHLISLWFALRFRSGNKLVVAILLPALAFRMTLLFSEPIQEVDIYRYCWDGACASEGVSPFRYSPWRIKTAFSGEPEFVLPEADVQEVKLIQLRDRDQGLAEVLGRVHYSELTTIYPPVSQLVFALADRTTPSGASVSLRVLVMKTWIVAFDVGVLLALLAGLLALNQHVAWLIPYGWSPLVLKEFANSGHLDSIAVFFTMAGVLCLVWAAAKARPVRGAWCLGFAAISLGLGAGAKLFPVVLLPLCVVYVWRRFSIPAAVAFGALSTLCVAVSLLPMLLAERVRNQSPASTSPVARQLSKANDLPPAPSDTGLEESASGSNVFQSVDGELPSGDLPSGAPAAEMAQADEPNAFGFSLPLPPFDEEPGVGLMAESEMATLPSPIPEANEDGLVEFLSRWEMNDLIFMVIEENLRPAVDDATPWFVVVPDTWRNTVHEQLMEASALGGQRDPLPANRVAFSVTRLLTLIAFGGVLLWQCWGVMRGAEEDIRLRLLSGVFMLLAWFWFLSPTQNPWYWTWALPFVIFARNRLWLLVGGLALVYYLRFWFLYEYPQTDMWGLGYLGPSFFDYVVVWFEFGIFLSCLFLSVLWRPLRFEDRPFRRVE